MPRFLSYLSDQLWLERKPLCCYALALLLAVCMIAFLYPASFLAGHGAFFESGDAAQHVSGWMAFARDGWHFPLLHTDRLNVPDGISIAFTDSIPLAALVFKPLTHFLPDQFHYIGAWHAIAYLTQALGAVWLIRVLGQRSILAASVAVIFCLSWPALLFRLGHSSLMTHSLLLAALACYFKGHSRSWTPRQTSAAFLLLGLLALLVHPYLLVMVWAAYLAHVLECSGHLRSLGLKLWHEPLWLCLGNAACILVAALLLGYFGSSGSGAEGFDTFSMNLAAPFCGGVLLDCGKFVGPDGQSEGFNLLGAGVMLLLPFALVLQRSSLRQMATHHRVLIVVMTGLTIYSLSNRVYFFNTELIHYSLPTFLKPITEMFRASGRFFWPVGYAILFFVLVSVLRQRGKIAVFVLIAAVLLQWRDSEGLRASVQVQTARQGTLRWDNWQWLAKGVDEVRLVPEFGCPSMVPENVLNWQLLATHFGLRFNTVYAARFSASRCRALDDFIFGRFEPGALYVVPIILADKMLLSTPPRTTCVSQEIFILCGRPLEKLPVPNGLIPYRFAAGDERFWPASSLPTNIGVLRNGVLRPRPDSTAGVLSFGPYAVLSPGQYRYWIDYSASAESGRKVGTWDVTLDGRTVASGELAGTQTQFGRIKGYLDVGPKQALLEIRSFSSPDEDAQLLGVGVMRINYEATLAEGINFKKQGYPDFLFGVSGMSGYEPWGRWTEAAAGSAAKFRFKQSLPRKFTLDITAVAFGPNNDKPVKVRVGEIEKTFVITPANEPATYRLEFEADGIADTLEITAPQPTSPHEIDQKASDTRKLGIGFVSLKINNRTE